MRGSFRRLDPLEVAGSTSGDPLDVAISLAHPCTRCLLHSSVNGNRSRSRDRAAAHAARAGEHS